MSENSRSSDDNDGSTISGDNNSNNDDEEERNSIDSDESIDESQLSFFQALHYRFKKIRKEFVQEVQNYGPPYVPDEKLYPESLIYEFSLLNPDTRKIHKLLNKRANPNSLDIGDFNFNPLMWCARRCHIKVAQMLIDAHVNVNLMNEFGHSALILLVMFKPPERNTSKIRMKFQFAQLLVEHGADINIRDKGGFSALDFAAINQDFQMVQYFLDLRAQVNLDHQYLTTQRQHILTYVTDPDVYRIIKTRLDEEAAAFAEIERKKQEEIERQLEEERIRLALLEKKRWKGRNRELRALRLQELEDAKAIENKLAIRSALDKQMDSYMKPPSQEAKMYRAGEWVRDSHGTWGVRLKSEFTSNFDKVYKDAKDTVKQLREEQDYKNLQRRWKRSNLIGGGPLKAVFRQNKLFELPSLNETAKNKTSHNVVIQDELKAQLDFEVKNDLDEALDGENLDDFVGYLKPQQPTKTTPAVVAPSRKKR